MTEVSSSNRHHPEDQHIRMMQYYRFQSKIYDSTRWSFLFGRERAIRLLKHYKPAARRILEVGCGSGSNLVRLSRAFPEATITGIDISKDMLILAKKKVANLDHIFLVHGSFLDQQNKEPWDAILFSYSLSMINPQFMQVINHANDQLVPEGSISVVDFHNSRLKIFKNHMGNNHVRMDSHLRTVLHRTFKPQETKIKNAYGGLWQFFHFIGKKSTL